MSIVIQSSDDIEAWYDTRDPWGYETNGDDENRRAILLSEIPRRHFLTTLDIGCGEGFVTGRLPGDSVLGIDISKKAISRAQNEYTDPRFRFQVGSLFDLPSLVPEEHFDLITITGVLYPQYIGRSEGLVYDIIDSLLSPDGVLVTAHVHEWCKARFPFFTLQEIYYPYRDHTHCLRVYSK